MDIKAYTKYKKPLDFTIPGQPPKSGIHVGFDIICRHCNTRNNVVATEDYMSDHCGASEHIPSQIWLVIHCLECGNRLMVWTDWHPKELNFGSQE